jgi:hypothetical protein
MADIYKTIASSGADFDSLAAAEASIPNSSADNFTFEYVEAFTDTTQCNFEVAGFTGTILVTVAEAYRCNGAVSGSHAEIVWNSATNINTIQVLLKNLTIQHLRIEKTGTAGAPVDFGVYGASDNATLEDCTVIRRNAGAYAVFILSNAPNAKIMGNNFLCSGKTSGAIIDLNHQPAATVTAKFYRNKLIQPDGTASTYVTVRATTSLTVDAQQNVLLHGAGATQTSGYFLGTNGAWAAGSDRNVSGKAANAPGTNGSNSVVAADVFKSVTVGAEDLDWISFAAMSQFGSGNDLSADVGTLDIKGDTIFGWYPGSDEVRNPRLVTAGGQFIGLSGNRFVIA